MLVLAGNHRAVVADLHNTEYTAVTILQMRPASSGTLSCRQSCKVGGNNQRNKPEKGGKRVLEAEQWVQQLVYWLCYVLRKRRLSFWTRGEDEKKEYLRYRGRGAGANKRLLLEGFSFRDWRGRTMAG